MQVQEIMTKAVVTVSEYDSIERATEIMFRANVSGVPVVDSQGNIVGVFSESDILKHLKKLVDVEIGTRYLSDPTHSLALFSLLSQRSPALSDEVLEKLRTTAVREAMTTRLIVAKPTDSVEDVARLMIENDVNRIPIVTGVQVVGIVSRADIARYFATRGGRE